MPEINGDTPRFALLIPAEVKCEYTGIPQGEYYTDLQKAVDVSNEFPERFADATGYAPPVSHPTPVTAYEGVAALGGILQFPRDHQPMLRNQGAVLTEKSQIDRLQVPVPEEQERFRTILARHEELKRRFPETASSGIGGQEGPVTTAVLLRGQQFFMDCIEDPDRAHKLLSVCTDMFITWNKKSMDVDGINPRVAGICDDHAGLLGPDMWDEFVIPYYRRIGAALGPNGISLHTELVNRSHLPHLTSLNLVSINFAEDQLISIRDVFEALPGVPFGWHILTVQEMQQGTPDLIRRRCDEILAAGVTEIRCELTVNTPPENIRAVLAAEREHTS